MKLHEKILNAMTVGTYLDTVKVGGEMNENFKVETKAGTFTLISKWLAGEVNVLRDNEKFVVIQGRDDFWSDRAFLVYAVDKNVEINKELTAGCAFKELTADEVRDFRAYKALLKNKG